jgi:hypothetical protein
MTDHRPTNDPLLRDTTDAGRLRNGSTMSDDVTVTEARQGRTGRHAFGILIASMALAVIAIIALMSWQQRSLPDAAPSASRSTITTPQATNSTTPPNTTASPGATGTQGGSTGSTTNR